MTKDTTADITGKIVKMLTPLKSEERQRIVNASLILVGEPLINLTKDDEGQKLGEDIVNLPPKAQVWFRQNSLSMEELQQVFLMNDGNIEVIISEIPGKGNVQKTYNAYILTGIAKFLSSGDACFDDKSARALCEASGCYDRINHATNLKKKGNEFVGTKNKGWTLTAPGLKCGAALIKELNK